jgi:hypothetical protein
MPIRSTTSRDSRRDRALYDLIRRGTNFWTTGIRLLCERADIGRNVLRFTPRQRQVHPRVRIEQRERKHFRIEAEFPGDHLKWWGIGDLPALVWFNGMARHAAGLRQTLAVIHVSGERGWRKQDCGKQQAKSKRSHHSCARILSPRSNRTYHTVFSRAVLIGQNGLVQQRVAAIGAIENAEVLLNGLGTRSCFPPARLDEGRGVRSFAFRPLELNARGSQTAIQVPVPCQWPPIIQEDLDRLPICNPAEDDERKRGLGETVPILIWIRNRAQFSLFTCSRKGQTYRHKWNACFAGGGDRVCDPHRTRRSARGRSAGPWPCFGRAPLRSMSCCAKGTGAISQRECPFLPSHGVHSRDDSNRIVRGAQYVAPHHAQHHARTR